MDSCEGMIVVYVYMSVERLKSCTDKILDS